MGCRVALSNARGCLTNRESDDTLSYVNMELE